MKKKNKHYKTKYSTAYLTFRKYAMDCLDLLETHFFLAVLSKVLWNINSFDDPCAIVGVRPDHEFEGCLWGGLSL